MTELDEGSLAETPASTASSRAAGILPSQQLRELVANGEIESDTKGLADLIQPASIDLRLGGVAHRLRASFLPGEGRPVAERIEEFSMHSIDLKDGAVLEVGCVYIVPLMERLNLGAAVSGIANPKSSTGRLNVFTRLISDGATEFDRVPAGYRGPLYAEIAPNAFSILVRPGTRLNQLRLQRGSPNLRDGTLRQLNEEVGLVGERPEAAKISKGLIFTVDLAGLGQERLIGFRAKRHTGVIDLSRIGHYDPSEYWDPLPASPKRGLILDPNEFYILASKETVRIPPTHAAEMIPYDNAIGEFRVHYAGFFDPGFGWAPEGGAGTRAVLEVRSHEVPFLIEDGQAVGRLAYDRLAEQPDVLYGAKIGSSYHAQGLTLSKHFKPLDEGTAARQG